MYYVKKEMEIAGAHNLDLPYESLCSNIHGHNWIVCVYCRSKELTDYGMIVDFAKVKQAIHGRLDHSYINDVVSPLNPTAENMAKWICDIVDAVCEVGECYRVDVEESQNNLAVYMKDEDFEVC